MVDRLRGEFFSCDSNHAGHSTHWHPSRGQAFEHLEEDKQMAADVPSPRAIHEEAYKAGWNAAVDEVMRRLDILQAAVKAGADPVKMLKALAEIGVK